MADLEQNQRGGERRVVAETVVDVSETIIDNDFHLMGLSGCITFDASMVAAGEGRMAACVSSEVFSIHIDEVIGSGSQGIIVRSTDSTGAEYAAKISYPFATIRDRRNRKAVLDSLISLMDEHPLGRNHYKQTHLMPLYAYGKIIGSTDSGLSEYNIAVMALCDSNLGESQGCSYEEIRQTVLPQTAEGLRALHAQGIVHRDIKPKNLYLLNGSIVLGDYGISSLLDEDKDTSATVFDKRTPGYSPHSSVVQRENDWYALGYTIWTLYNHGEHPHQALIDAGDLSAVLAGKRPVEFIPRSPDEASLGELIYGLTLETPRARLGYKDIQEWLEDPAAFRFENPFDVTKSIRIYQFRGRDYSDNSELADAMNAYWDDASEHILSGMLEDFLKSTGQQDLAVRIYKAMSEAQEWDDVDFGIASVITLLKKSPHEFAWKGQWYSRADIADESFARLTTEPYVMYEYASELQKVRELLRFLVVAYVGEQTFAQDETLVRAAYSGISGLKDSDVILRVDNLLTLFEVLCSNKVAVRSFFIDYGPYGDSVWIKQHIGSYIGTTEDSKRMIGEVRGARFPSPVIESLEQIREMLKTLENCVEPLTAILPVNPYMNMFDLERETSVVIETTNAYRVARVYGERCTIGYVALIVSPEKRDGICDFATLRGIAVNEARETANRIRESANMSGQSPVGAHSKTRNIILILCTLVVFVIAWNSFGDLRQDYLRGFDTYAPIMEEAGGIVPDAWFGANADSSEASTDRGANTPVVAYEVAPAAVPPQGYVADGMATTQTTSGSVADAASAPMNSCIFGLNVALFGFMVAGLCVLCRRLFELIPSVFSSFVRTRQMRYVTKLESDANKLEGMTLSHSVEMLLADNHTTRKSPVFSLVSSADSENDLFRIIMQWADRCYKVAVVLLIVGIVLATVTWVPLGLGHLTAAQIQSLRPGEMLYGQGSFLFALTILYAIVFWKGGIRPNMVVVVFLSLPLVFFAWFCA